MKILVCEDEQPWRQIIELTLTPRGHEVVLTENVAEAVVAFETSRTGDAPFDLIISDVRVPGPSGYSLAGYVRGAGYKGRLAMLTASEPELGNLASVKAEYWPKQKALGDLVNRVELPPAQATY